MNVKALDRMKKQPVAGVDYPLFKGKVTVKLHNVHNGKNEVHESHNAPTNAIADLFANNYGGLLNYNNFAALNIHSSYHSSYRPVIKPYQLQP